MLQATAAKRELAILRENQVGAPSAWRSPMRLPLLSAACVFGYLLASSQVSAAEGDESQSSSSMFPSFEAEATNPPNGTVSSSAAASNPWKGAPSTRAAETTWVANRPLLIVGASLTAIGYGPNFALALPSTGGVFVRAFALLFTLGLGCIFDELYGRSGSGYVCYGQHGAMQLLVPFAGPIMFANTHPRDSVLNTAGGPLSSATKGLLYTSSALQIAGVSSMLLSLAFGRSVPLQRPTAAGPSVYLAPLESPDVAGATVGLSLGLQRW